jgi:aldose 1-epimerase
MWQLEDHLPLGSRQAASGQFDLRAGQDLDDRAYDDVFRVASNDDKVALEIQDPANRRAVIVSTSAKQGFRDFVLYAPRQRSIVALEPYTCTTDALNLQSRGIDTGLRELPPGATWSGSVVIVAETIALD